MKRKIKIALIISSVFVWGVLFLACDNKGQAKIFGSEEAFVTERYKVLAKLAKNEKPQTVISAQIAFKNFVPISLVETMFNENMFHIKLVYDGSGLYQGVFKIDSKSSLHDEVLKRKKGDMKYLLGQIEYTKERLKGKEKSEDIQRLETYLMELDQRLENLTNGGIQVYGLEVEGTAKDFKNLQDNYSHNYIKFINPILSMFDRVRILKPLIGE